MIQLATAPDASRSNWPSTGPGAKEDESVQAERKGRTGHAWPFISRLAERPLAAQTTRRAPVSWGS